MSGPDDVAAALFDARTAPGATLRDGIVTAVSPLTITVPPSTVASPAVALDSYVPLAGDFVQVLVQGANRLILGSRGRTTAWAALSFTSPWANYGAPWPAARYRRLGDMVQLNGLVAPSSTTAATPVIGTLPAGFRPPENAIYNVRTSITGNTARCDVLTGSGSIQLSEAPAIAAGNWFSLSGIWVPLT